MYKRYWLVSFWPNEFEVKMLVYGTEEELWAYLGSEIGGGTEYVTGNFTYHGASDEEVAAAKVLKMKAYLCPEIRK